MIIVGLTGGIGSGKTTVAKIFEHLNIPIFYSDEQSKEILNTNPKVKESLQHYFGPSIYSRGTLNRKILAQKIFDNPNALAKVNAIVHPAVAETFAKWCANKNAPYCLKEAAILFESGSYKQLDKNILVVAHKELRLKRVKSRESWSVDEIEKRMANQWTDEKKIPLSDFVIYNNTEDVLIPQILKIHENLIRTANQTG